MFTLYNKKYFLIFFLIVPCISFSDDDFNNIKEIKERSVKNVQEMTQVVNREPEGLKYGVGFGALICGAAKMVRGFRSLHTVVTFVLPAAVISYLVASRNTEIRDLKWEIKKINESAKSYCTSSEASKESAQKLQEEIDGLRRKLKEYQDDFNLRQKFKEEEKENQRKAQELQKETEITELRKELLKLQEALKSTQAKSAEAN